VIGGLRKTGRFARGIARLQSGIAGGSRAGQRPERGAGTSGVGVEFLEPRRLLAFDPSAQAQELLEHVNRMRMNPQAEWPILFTSLSPLRARDPDANLAVQGLNDPTTALVNAEWPRLQPAAPLAWNASLSAAATAHSQLIIQFDTQSHQLPGEASLVDRTRAAGYAGYSAIGENVFAFSKSAFNAHSAFAIDWGVPNRGHRTMIMDPAFREFGAGMVADASPATTVGPLVVTQNFGSRFADGGPFLVGVVYRDANANLRYDAGEGLGGATVQIVGPGGTFTTTTMTAGGYQLQVPQGTYTITATGGGLAQAQQAVGVQVAAANVKVDFKASAAVGPFTPVRTVGAVEFGTIAAGYAVRSGGATGAVLPVTFGGVNASAKNPGAGWAAVGARASGSGYEVFWRNVGAGAYAAWTLDAAGARTGGRGLTVAETQAVESQVGFDITGDAQIGVPAVVFTSVRTVGAVEFGTVPAGYAVRSGGAAGTVLPVTFGGVKASATNPGAGWAAVGARASGSGYEVFWRNVGAGAYAAWTLDAAGARTGGRGLTVAETQAVESQVNFDITGDGRIGVPTVVFTSVRTVGAVEFGTVPAGYAVRSGGVSGAVIPVTFGGVNASATNPGAGWTAISARASVGGFQVLWRHTLGSYAQWTLNASGVRTSGTAITAQQAQSGW
jgi:uncharacterized protein YkwD